jgi:hypothetical protein
MADPRSNDARYREEEVGRILTEVEANVQQAMIWAGYKAEGTDRDWVPFSALLEAYYRWYQEIGALHTDTRLKNPREFGRILGVLFPEAYMVKRRVNGKLVVGRARMTGPKGIRSNFAESG